MKYAIEVKETLSRTIVVEAEDKYEAEDKVKDAYRYGEITLVADDFFDVEFINKTERYNEDQLSLFQNLEEQED